MNTHLVSDEHLECSLCPPALEAQGEIAFAVRLRILGLRAFDLDWHFASRSFIGRWHAQFQHSMIIRRFDVLRADSPREGNQALKTAVGQFAMDKIPVLLLVMMLTRGPYDYDILCDHDFNILWFDSRQVQSDDVFASIEERGRSQRLCRQGRPKQYHYLLTDGEEDLTEILARRPKPFARRPFAPFRQSFGRVSFQLKPTL